MTKRRKEDEKKKQNHGVKSAHQRMGCTWPLPAAFLTSPGKPVSFTLPTWLGSIFKPRASVTVPECLQVNGTGLEVREPGIYRSTILVADKIIDTYGEKHDFHSELGIIHDSELGCPASRPHTTCEMGVSHHSSVIRGITPET